MTVPDVVQRAARLFFAVSLVAAIGTTILFITTEAYTLSDMALQIKLATAGAGITCVVGQAPFIGNLARAGFENAVGTMLGGATGFVIFVLADHLTQLIPLMEDAFLQEYMIRVCFAPVVGFAGVFFGWGVGMDISGKLVLLTYLLVTINNRNEHDAGTYAVTRTLAILTGVFCSHISQLLVFPRSASNECIQLLRRGLRTLSNLSDAVWASAEANLTALAAGAEDIPTPLLLASRHEGVDELDLANYYGNINGAFRTAEGYMSAAAYEVYVGHCAGVWCYLPGVSSLHRGVWKLPEVEMRDVINSARCITRLLYSVHKVLRGTRLWRTVRHNAAASSILSKLSATSCAVIDDMASAFPDADSIPFDNLVAFTAAAAALKQVPPPAPAWDQDCKNPQREIVLWYSFQFAVAELSSEVSELHRRLSRLQPLFMNELGQRRRATCGTCGSVLPHPGAPCCQ